LSFVGVSFTGEAVLNNSALTAVLCEVHYFQDSAFQGSSYLSQGLCTELPASVVFLPRGK